MNVLICVSELPFAEKTVQMGGLIANLLQRPVSLLKVIGQNGEKETAVATLQEAEQMLETPVTETAVSLGTPSQEILNQAESGRYSLIAIGAHTTRNLWDQFLQSVTQKVANQTTVSVLVVRDEPPALRRILICTSGHSNSEMVVRNGAALARLAGAKVTLLHVTKSLPAMYTGLQEMEETLPELLQTDTPLAQHLRWASEYLVKTQVPAELKLRHGIAVDELLAETQAVSYDLMMIGSQTEHNLLNSLLLGQVTPKIIDNAPCSVLVIRGDL